jgi:hypothetical protein
MPHCAPSPTPCPFPKRQMSQNPGFGKRQGSSPWGNEIRSCRKFFITPLGPAPRSHCQCSLAVPSPISRAFHLYTRIMNEAIEYQAHAWRLAPPHFILEFFSKTHIRVSGLRNNATVCRMSTPPYTWLDATCPVSSRTAYRLMKDKV